MTSVLIGASRPEQVTENVGALKNLEFSKEELAEIDQYATEGGIRRRHQSVGKAFDGSADLILIRHQGILE